MATLDNSDISSVIEFHTQHGIRDAYRKSILALREQ